MTTVTIETSPRNAWTDPESGMRFYRFGGRDLPSVTTLRRMAGVPHGLHQWTIKQVVERATVQNETLVAMLTRDRKPRERVLESNRVAEAGRWLRAAATESRDASASLGTAVHDAATRGLTPLDLPDPFTFTKDGQVVEIAAEDIAPRLFWYRNWLAVSGATVVGAEFQVANLSVGYAGSCDLLVRFPNGTSWVVDIKTGRGTYPEHALQVLAYRNAEIVFHDDVVDEAMTQELHTATGIAILHLHDGGWSFEALKPDDGLWEAFLGLHKFAMWSHHNPTMERLVMGRRQSTVQEIAA